MSPMKFGTIKCTICKGTGFNLRMEGDCSQCKGTGWLPPARQRELAEEAERRSPPRVPPHEPPESKMSGEDVVIAASDAIKPIVQDNEFSREALEKVVRRGRDRSMRRVILYDLHTIFPSGQSSSQFEATYGWLHQSCSAALTMLHKEGLISVIQWRFNERGNREGIYTLSALAKGAWDSVWREGPS